MHEEWGWLVAIYLFLGGLGAGSFLIGAIFELTGKREEFKTCAVTLLGAILPGPLIAIGTVLLIFDLGAGLQKPWLIPLMFSNITSVMTWGIIILTIFIPLCFVYGFLEIMDCYPPYWERIITHKWFNKRKKLQNFLETVQIKPIKRKLAWIGSVLAVSTALYTGVLISAVGPAYPLWSTPVFPFLPIPMLPLLFLVSAISTGVAMTVDLADAFSEEDIHHKIFRLPLIHLAIIVIETLLIGLLFLTAFLEGGAAAQSVRDILTGPLSIIFWGLIVLPGFVFPFIVHAYVAAGLNTITNPISLASAIGIFISGLFIRFIIIAGGIPAFL